MEHLLEWFCKSSMSTHGLSFNPDGSVVDPVAFQKIILSNSDLTDQLVQTDPEFTKLVQGDDLDVLQEISIECHHHSLRLQQREVLPSKVEMVKLYAVMEVNDYPLKALVDIGVESSFMPKNYADHCRIMDLVDEDCKGVIHGVQSGILGRVHSTPIKVGKQFFEGSFLVLDSPVVDVVFGLDMLSKHQCIIDYTKKVLKIGFGNEVRLLEGKDADVEVEAKRTKLASSSEEEEEEEEEEEKGKGKEVDEEEDFKKKLAFFVRKGYNEQDAKEALQQTNRNLFATIEYLWKMKSVLIVPCT